MTATAKQVEGKNEVATIKDILNFRSIEELEAYGARLIKAGFTPLETPAQVVAAVLTGRELGFGFSFSVNNIYPIEGKSTLGIHAITKLLLEAGVVIEVIRDFQPCVSFVMKGEDGLPCLEDANGKEVKRGDDKKAPAGSRNVFIREGFIDEDPRDYEIKGRKIINNRTVIKMTRLLKQPNGTFQPMIVIDSYSIGEASNVFIDKNRTKRLTDKSNWQNYPRQMCYARALSIVGKKIGDDILGGLPETSEYADVKNVDYSVNEEGKVTIIKEEVIKEGSPSNIKAEDVEEVKGETSSESDKDENSPIN